MKQSNIRLATLDDLDIIQKLNAQLFAFEQQFSDSYNRNWMYEPAGIDYFTRRIANADGNSICLVASSENNIIGYLAAYVGTCAYRSLNPIVELENMFVTEQFRGQGVGTLLVERMKTIAQTKGAKRMRVGLLADNTKAQAFYAECGFKSHELIMESEL
jgi:GNAT superfamily N-acetyltransferase